MKTSMKLFKTTVEVKRQLAKVDPAALRAELKEYGAWDANELANHEDNLQRLVWIAGSDIQEAL